MLTEKQKIILKLYSRGKNVAEISKKMGYSRNTVYYALKSGQDKLDKIIETIEFATKNGILTEKQISRLRRIVSRLK